MSPVGACGVPGGGGVGSGIRCLRLGGGGAPVLRVSSMSADSLRCHFGKEGSRTLGFDKALPGVFVSQPSPFCAKETQHHASVLLGPRRVVSL